MKTFLLQLTAFLSLVAPLFALPVRLVTWNVFQGLDSTSSASYQTAETILRRVGADVVCLQEVKRIDTGPSSPLAQLGTTLGLPHRFVPERGSFDSQNVVVFLSRYPFSRTESLVSPTGSRDQTRAHPYVRLNLPGATQDLHLIGVHLKCCGMAPDLFRRAVEMDRIRRFFTEENLTASDAVAVLGDFNSITFEATFNETPVGLPQTFSLSPGVMLPLTHFPNPAQFFTNPNLQRVVALHQDNVRSNTFQGGSSTLDHILLSQFLHTRITAREVFNPALDATNPGIAKVGAPLDNGPLDPEYDHFPVIAEVSFPASDPLVLERASGTGDLLLEENQAVMLRVTFPEAATTTRTVDLITSDPTETQVTEPIAVLPGQTSVTFPVEGLWDSMIDGNQNVTLVAQSGDLASAPLAATVVDRSVARRGLVDFESALEERFAGFEGLQAPAAWDFENATWGGVLVDGQLGYGTAMEGGLVFHGEVERSTRLRLRNDTGEKIDVLELTATRSVWEPGSPLSSLSFALVTPRGTTPLPAFMASPIQSSQPTVRQQLENLDLPAGADFEIEVTYQAPLVPVANPAASINEFHYDNMGSDQGEFVEVLLPPGFPQSVIANSEVVLYNGNNGRAYDCVPLADFAIGDHQGGYRLLSFVFPSIQNGPDGIALVISGSVLEFLSYEGSFEAVDGPALGLMSTDVGVSQGSATPIGQRSLIRTTLAGSDAPWAVAEGAHSPGQFNPSQNPPATNTQPAGFLLSSLIVEAHLDSDGDGKAAPADDFDQDGQSDRYEYRAGSNPRDSTSRFFPSITAISPIKVQLNVPAVAGRQYAIRTTKDLAQPTPEWSLQAVVNTEKPTLSISPSPTCKRQFFQVIPANVLQENARPRTITVDSN